MQPQIGKPSDGDSGLTTEQKSEVERIRDNYVFNIELNLSFRNSDFNNFHPAGKSGTAGVADKNSIGGFNGRDVFRVQKFDGGDGGPENSKIKKDKGDAERAVHGPKGEDGAIGFRDTAYYNQKHNETLQLDTDSSGIQHLVQRGAVKSGAPIQTESEDTQLITTWIDTYGITFNNNRSAKVRDIREPGVTFRQNTFFEIDVSFQHMQCPGHRHSFWLWPSTVSDGTGPAVDFDDRRQYVGDVVYTGPHDAENGVEIDIYEHVVTPDHEDTMLMKAISGDKNPDSSRAPNGSGNTINTYTNDSEPNTHIDIEGINSGFHKIGFLWLKNEMIWFVDGIPLVRDDKLMPNNRRMSMILSREASKELFGGDPTLPGNRTNFLDDIVKIRSIRVWDVIANTSPPPPHVVTHRFDGTTGIVVWNKLNHSTFDVFSVTDNLNLNSNPISGDRFRVTTLLPGRSLIVEVRARTDSGFIRLGQATFEI